MRDFSETTKEILQVCNKIQLLQLQNCWFMELSTGGHHKCSYVSVTNYSAEVWCSVGQ